MRREDVFIVVLWGALIGILGLILYNFRDAIAALGSVAAATVSALALLLGAILTHALTEIREQRTRQMLERQKNYLKLIENIGVLIRAPDSWKDEFSKIYLESCVLGSQEVVTLLRNFSDELLIDNGEDNDKVRKREALKLILIRMRSEVGLGNNDLELPSKMFPKTKGM